MYASSRDSPRCVPARLTPEKTARGGAAFPTPGGGPGYHRSVSDAGERLASEVGTELGLAVVRVEAVEGDASRRMFYRLSLRQGSVIAAVYPEGAEEQVERDARVQRWGFARSLPIPEPLGHRGRVSLSEDLGSQDLGRAVRRHGSAPLVGALEALRAFQQCDWGDCPTPPFDAAFFRRELAVFEQYGMPQGGPGGGGASRFLDDLCTRLAAHPFRLVHRDYHVNNLFLSGGRVRAVDYQDMRGGPDTYDAASLLRERAGGECIVSDREWQERAASLLSWGAGWRVRYLECAAQRGVKVVGTFLRLASWGRTHYLAWLPLVRRRAAEALIELDAPRPLVEAVQPPD